MFNKIKESWQNYKTKCREQSKKYWEKFKTYLSPSTQSFLDKIEKIFIKFDIMETINTILFVIVMVIIIRFFFGEIRWIPSGSMHPTLIEGDRIVVERYSRFFTSPKRGDIMIFYPPSTQLTYKPMDILKRLTGIYCRDIAYIKRVVGMPGDKIEIKQEPNGASYVYINDKKYEENYIQSIYEYPACPNQNDLDILNSSYHKNHIMKCGPFQLGKKEYFMMGDNRGNSQDSRYWGVLKEDRFIGRAVAVFWPINRIKSLIRPKINF